MENGQQAGKSIYHRERNLVPLLHICSSARPVFVCACVFVAEGIGRQRECWPAVLGGSSLPYYCHVSD